MTPSIILTDKPAGITSFSTVSRVKRLYGIKKAGHCGTLDPDATGLLPIMLDNGVKAAEILTDHDKSYTASIALGVTTDTGDTGGKVLSSCDASGVTFDEFRDVALTFVGEQMQLPPMYSALKVNGQKLVDLARRGVEAEREERRITVYSLEPYEKDGVFYMDVSVSRGTYIRTLCEDIGKKLGCGAAMASLRRTRVGKFSVADAYTLDELAEMTQERRLEAAIPVETLFSSLRAFTAEGFFEKLALNGCEIYLHKTGFEASEGEQVRMYTKDGFFALGKVMRFDDGLAVKAVKRFV